MALWGETPDANETVPCDDLRGGGLAILSPSTSSTKASTSRPVDTHPDAAPDRKRHALPPATRPRPSEVRDKALVHASWISSARIARSSDSTRALAPYSAVPGRSLYARSRGSSRFSRRGATWGAERVAHEHRPRQHPVGDPQQLPTTSRRIATIGDVTLTEFLDASGLELTDIYAGVGATGPTFAEPPASSLRNPQWGRYPTDLHERCRPTPARGR